MGKTEFASMEMHFLSYLSMADAVFFCLYGEVDMVFFLNILHD